MKKFVILVLVVLVTVFFYEKISKGSGEDKKACNEARTAASIEAWKSYIEQFPNGRCVKEAKVFFDKVDEQACNEAKQKNTLADWEDYLSRYPKGKCAEEAKLNKEKVRKVGGFEWSDLFYSEGYVLKEAEEYCKKLDEGGHTDWRLPNIDELRTLVRNSRKTETGGECKVSEKSGCLSVDCAESCFSAEDGNGSSFSMLGDSDVSLVSFSPVVSTQGAQRKTVPKVKETDDLIHIHPVTLWYIRHLAQKENASADAVWTLDFKSGSLKDSGKRGDYENLTARCVRQDDHDACETAKKYNNPYYWVFYFDNFPNGECMTEAKVVWENEDKKACDEARKANSRASWEAYLHDFPKGNCIEEGKKIRNKFKKIGNLEWSDRSVYEIDFNKAIPWSADDKAYCLNLDEDGHKDWRLPDIDELRTLVQNHSGTITDGSCKISEETEKNSEIDATKSCFDDICKGNCSKLGDTVELWSDSPFSRMYLGYREIEQLTLDFSDGTIGISSRSPGNYVRCVRGEDKNSSSRNKAEGNDNEAAETEDEAEEARKKPEDSELCETARAKDTRAAWEIYLHNYPNGKCAEEGKAVRNKFKKVGGLEWSDVHGDGSCDELVEDGHNDWRNPNIDELRMLVKKHPGTVTGGKCNISEYDGSLSLSDMHAADCLGSEGEDFSVFGDSGWFFTSSEVDDLSSNFVWSIYFDNGALFPLKHLEISYKLRCVRQDKNEACEYARKDLTGYSWTRYLENFPDGECVKEAKESLDKISCNKAMKANLLSLWEEYLEEFPEGKCADEAKAAKKKLNKTGTLEWSEISDDYMHLDAAVEYCKNHEESGLKDWRLPTIDELRMLIRNCPGSQSGGECRISGTCNSLGCITPKCSCRQDGTDGYYSKFGDDESVSLWSSSPHKGPLHYTKRFDPVSDYKSSDFVGAVEFKNAMLYFVAGNELQKVRCVRQSDSDACKSARKDSSVYSWSFYLKNFPDGECSAEAKAGLTKALEKEEENMCKAAKKLNKLADWEKYLKRFPDGKCAEEAKSNKEKLRKIGEFEWSDMADREMSQKEAVEYCSNLTEGGHDDWRLPSISELRTAIDNCPNMQNDGACNVKDNCLSYDCLNVKSCFCERKDFNNGIYSRLGDDAMVILWSSSSESDSPYGAWTIAFVDASIEDLNKDSRSGYVRCIR